MDHQHGIGGGHLASDGNGGFFVTGGTDGSIDGTQQHKGDADVFIAKYNGNGEQAWIKQFGGSQADFAHSFTSDGNGNAFVGGRTHGSINNQPSIGGIDAYISKYNSSGQEVWTRQFGSAAGEAVDYIIPDGNGGVFVAGNTGGSLTGQPFDGKDIYVAKYNSSGQEVWTKQFGTPEIQDNINSLVSDGNGGVFLAGSTFGGHGYGGAKPDAYIANLNGNGDTVWTKAFGSSESDLAERIIPDGNGGAFVSGATGGNINGQQHQGWWDSFIANFNSSGQEVWLKQFGTPAYESITSLIPDGSGGVIAAGTGAWGGGGSINGQPHIGGQDAFIANYNSNGENTWTKQFGSTANENLYHGFAISSGNGDIFVTGQTDGSFYGQPYLGMQDVFVAKFSIPVPIIWSENGDTLSITGAGSGTAGGTAFSNNQAIDLKGGDDIATISTGGSLTGLLNGGSGTDTLNANGSNNSVTINSSGAGTVDGTSFSNFETINTLAGNDSVTVNNSATALTLNTGNGIDSLTSTATTAEALNVSGANTGTLGSIGFSELENVTLGSGNDTASISTTGSLTSLNAGSGTDTLNASASNNTLTLNASGSGSVDDTSISNFETVNLLAGDDKATVDLMNPATAAKSLSLNGGVGNDSLDIKLSDAEFAKLENTDALMKLSSYLADPNGKSLDIGFGEFSLNASGFESANFNHDIPFSSNPLKLKSIAASASDTASASGLEGLNLDVGGTANVQTPVTLKSTSEVSTVEGNVKSDAHATDVLGISASTLHAASDLSVGSALQSIVTGSAESTSGIAIANALVDTQHGIDLSNPFVGVDAIASGGSSTVISTSSLTATSSAQTVGDGSSDSGAQKLDGAWSNTISQDHLGLGSSAPSGVLTLDSESNATVSTSMLSKLSSTATANDGLAAASSQLLSSTGIENFNAEVGGLGLVTAINQGVFKADATSTTDDARAMGFNKASAGILDSTFTFGITDSTITAKDFNTAQISATSTGGDAWSKLQSSSTGIADLAGNHSITDAGSISAIASDQGFAHSATVSGSSTAFASQEAIGMSGYEVHNHSDLTLSAQSLVSSESSSSSVG